MPLWDAFHITRELAVLGLLLGVILGIGGYLVWRSLHSRITPEEMERRRRLSISGRGKLADGEIIDFEGAAIVYSYSVRGVGYTAAQDVMALAALLPEDRMSMIGPAQVKFDPRNPANSIVLCEDWSGLRGREREG